GRHVAKANDAELSPAKYLESAGLPQQPFGQLGEVAAVLDEPAEPPDAERFDREPDLHGPAAAGQGNSVTAKVHLAGIGMDVLHIFRLHRERLAEGLAVADEQAARFVILAEPLVGVEADRVRTF